MRAPQPESHDAPEAPDASRGGDGALRAALSPALERVRARIRDAAARAERPAPRLLAVTKSVPPDVALALAGLLEPDGRPVELAENRADGLARKAAAFEAAGRPVRWHFVGHVQRNKARRILEHTEVLHSVDSLRLVETLARLAKERGRPLNLYVQVNFTDEDAKDGLDAAGAREALRRAAAAPALRPLGLMAMGPLEERPGATTHGVFERVAALAREIEADPELARALPGGRCGLSLGMSDDLEEAIAAGSDIVRVGTDLFSDLAGREGVA